MKAFFAALTLAALAAGCSWDVRPQASPALGESDWTHPSGAYALSFESTGYVTADPAPYGEETLAAIEPRIRGEHLRLCQAKSRPLPAPPWVSQSDLNRTAEQFDFSALQADAGVSAPAVTHIDVDGVTVARADFDRDQFHFRYAVFALPNGLGATFHEVSCGGTNPLTLDELTAFDSILGSISFR